MARSYMLPKLRSPHETGNRGALKPRVLKTVDGAESHERDTVTDAVDEESQGTFVLPFHPFVGVEDMHHGHELTDTTGNKGSNSGRKTL